MKRLVIVAVLALAFSAAVAAAPEAPAPEDLKVTAWTDRPGPEVTVGDVIQVSFRPSAQALCYVIAVGTSGRSDLLFPNKKEVDHQVAAGAVRTIPGQSSYRIRVTGPAGHEVVIVIASTKALPVYESLGKIAPRKTAGALTLTGPVARDLTLEATGTPGTGTESPVDLEPFLAELERAGNVTRGKDLASALLVLAVREAASVPASPAPAASASPEPMLPAAAVPVPLEDAPSPEAVASPAAVAPASPASGAP